MQLKGSDRQFMEVGSCSIVENFLGFIWDI